MAGFAAETAYMGNSFFSIAIRLCVGLALCCPDFLFAQEALTIKSGGQLNIHSDGNLVIGGDVTLRKGAGLVNNGVIHLTNSVRSHWVDSTINSGSLSGLGAVFFEGTYPIFISGTSGFNDVIMNGSNLLLDTGSVFKVFNLLLLKKGVINGSLAAILINNPNAEAIKADTENPGYEKSYIAGLLRRSISSNTSLYDFPVGDTSSVHLIRFLNNKIVGSTILTAQFKPKPGTDEGINVYEDGNYTSLNNAGVWDLVADFAPRSGSYNLQLSTNGFLSLSDNQFGILARPGNSIKGADWKVPQGSSLPLPNTPGRLVSGGFAQRNLFTSFDNSQLGIGIISKVLPISLTDFQAKRMSNSHVQLDWKTLSENNNKGFYIERMQAGVSPFSIVSWVPSKSIGLISNTPLSYTYLDSNSLNTSTYYRLRQTDHNGQEKISQTVLVTGRQLQIKLYPNPTKGIIYIDLSSERTFKAVITNAEGRIVKMIKDIQTNKIDLTPFPNGQYTITIMGAGSNILLREKLILQK